MRQIFSLIFLFSSLYLQEIQTIQTEYYSPDRTKFVSYFGLDQGEGTFYHRNVADSLKILSTYFRYGPMVKWLNGSIIEFKVPTGSPNFHNYYYDYDKMELSRDFHSVKGINLDKEIVACADSDYDIVFYSVFDGYELYRYEVEDLEQNHMLGWTHIIESNFINDSYILKYCLDDFDKIYIDTIKVKIDKE